MAQKMRKKTIRLADRYINPKKALSMVITCYDHSYIRQSLLRLAHTNKPHFSTKKLLRSYPKPQKFLVIFWNNLEPSYMQARRKSDCQMKLWLWNSSGYLSNMRPYKIVRKFEYLFKCLVLHFKQRTQLSIGFLDN